MAKSWVLAEASLHLEPLKRSNQRSFFPEVPGQSLEWGPYDCYSFGLRTCAFRRLGLTWQGRLSLPHDPGPELLRAIAASAQARSKQFGESREFTVTCGESFAQNDEPA